MIQIKEKKNPYNQICCDPTQSVRSERSLWLAKVNEKGAAKNTILRA